MKPLDNEELYGFEMQLSEIQRYLDNFSKKHAKSSYAAYKGFPSDGSFSGKLLCGFAKKKGELKLDGTPKWHCPMKFDFFYYKVFDEKGDLHSSVFEEDFDEKSLPENFTYEIKYYEGCPAHLT